MNSPRLRDSNRWISDAVIQRGGHARPMQLGIGATAGNTWGDAPIHPASMGTGGYGIDGDHDGLVDVYDPATPSLSRQLPPGQRRGQRRARRDVRYNHSTSYVADVLGWAARYARGGAMLTAREVIIDADQPQIPVAIDGESVLMPTPVRCTIRPLALRVQVPRGRPGVPEPRPQLDWALLRRQALTFTRNRGRQLASSG